jgi:DNA-binding response OmpR family regulator
VTLGEVAIRTHVLSPWDERVPPPGRDATLLAVVPIPGTQTSLAIVGYAISTSGVPDHAPAHAEPSTQLLAGSGLVVDHAQRRVWADGIEIALTFQEFELLAFLSTHPATVFSRADLLECAWQRGPAHGGPVRDGRSIARDSRTIDVHISRLRHKLGPVYGTCLVTEHRAGYQFRPLAP